MSDMPAAEIPEAMRRHIDARLAAVEAEHGVRILFAVESGSRAWGFPSPDSDFDVRFVYAHPAEWYVSLAEKRDVIEAPLDAMLVDLAGWDVRKTLRLLMKSNAALYEWTHSPILYRDGPARARIGLLFETVAETNALWHHYHQTAMTTWRREMDGRDEVKLKRYVYVVRPLLAREWVRVHGTPPPMEVGDLLAAVPLAPDVANAFDALLATKRTTPEFGRGPRLPTLDAWIVEHLDEPPPARAAADRDDGWARADTLFQDLIGFAPVPG